MCLYVQIFVTVGSGCRFPKKVFTVIPLCCKFEIPDFAFVWSKEQYTETDLLVSNQYRCRFRGTPWEILIQGEATGKKNCKN